MHLRSNWGKTSDQTLMIEKVETIKMFLKRARYQPHFGILLLKANLNINLYNLQCIENVKFIKISVLGMSCSLKDIIQSFFISHISTHGPQTFLLCKYDWWPLASPGIQERFYLGQKFDFQMHSASYQHLLKMGGYSPICLLPLHLQINFLGEEKHPKVQLEF